MTAQLLKDAFDLPEKTQTEIPLCLKSLAKFMLTSARPGFQL